MDETTRERCIEAGAAAIYEEPYTYCEECKGIGQDENAMFWCYACKGQGYVVDEDDVPAAREVAELNAAAVLDAVLALRDDSGPLVTLRETDLGVQDGGTR